MPEIHSIYLIHHTHTDIGYTNDQPIVWDLNTRFIDEAIMLAEKHADHDSDGAFRWTIETTCGLQEWLRYASPEQIERLQTLERMGRIEIMALFAHLTPLVDTDQLMESLQYLQVLRKDYGFTVRHAMNCDVNGVNWPFVDTLLDAGIEGYSMAINTHFGGALKPRPRPFLWQGPSGRHLPTFNGWTYDKGWREGIGRDAEDFRQLRWPRLQRYLNEIDYPLPILMLQSYHPYGDVGTAYDFTEFIDSWNEAGHAPRIIMATPSMWWEAIKAHRAELPILRGDWTDYWNFGAISSAREQAINRQSREALRNADALHGVLEGLDSGALWARQSHARHRERAYWNLNLWDEHTWGADVAIRTPESDDTRSQWHHKAGYAYTARSLSQMLQRDTLADFARLVSRSSNDDLLIFNPLPWKRTLAGTVPAFVLSPRGLPDDSTAGRHHQDRQAVDWGDFFKADSHALPPTELDAFGYKIIPRSSLIDLSAHRASEESPIIENHRYRLEFDRSTGGIISLYDKELQHDWADPDSGFALHDFVHEAVADHAHEWPRKRLFHQEWSADLAEIPSGWRSDWRAHRSSVNGVISHQVFESPLGIRVVQTLAIDALEGVIHQEVFLPSYDDYIECSSSWQMGLETHPEATYLLFPFNLPGATVRYDTGGQAVIPEVDQLPGVCRDYFTVQNWVDFSTAERGITVTMPENPLVQFGDFNFGKYQQTFNLGNSVLLGWVTNNYWETNFRAHQPGRVSARYRLYTHAGGFDEARAHHCGQEAAQSRLLIQQLGEPTPATPLPNQGSLLSLPHGEVQTLHIKAASDGLLIRLQNVTDKAQTAVVAGGLLKVVKARYCDAFGNPETDVEVVEGAVHLTLEARRMMVVWLQVALA